MQKTRFCSPSKGSKHSDLKKNISGNNVTNTKFNLISLSQLKSIYANWRACATCNVICRTGY